MSETPPRPVQLHFIQKLQKQLSATVRTDPWEYAVSKTWVAALQKFIEDEGKGDATVPPLSSSDWDDNNMYVGEKSWVVLASWYGVESQYSFRRRATASHYIRVSGQSPELGAQAGSDAYVLTDTKMDFLTARCSLLKDMCAGGKHPFISIYFWESLDYIEFQVRCALKVHPEKSARMWLSLCDDGVDVLLENLSLYDKPNTSVGNVLCEKYPDILHMLERRQTAPVPCYPQATPGGESVKEDLSQAFVNNLWQLMLCLEVLSPTFKEVPAATATDPAVNAVPRQFLQLSLDNVFQQETASSSWDEEMQQLLDDSMSDFSKLVTEQRDKLQTRTEQLLKEARQSYLSQEQQVRKKMEETEAKENQLNAREKELNERDHELNSKLAKFKSMLTEFLTNKDKFEKEASHLAAQNAITASKVELNVGGVRYTTSLSTLTKEEGSMLQVMFSGKHALAPDKDGSYFIDRDGTHFRHVLNFLRDGPASLQSLDGNTRLLSELRAEAEHYQLHRMAETLRVRMCGEQAHGDCVSLPS